MSFESIAYKIRQKLGKVIQYTEDVLAISCLGTVAQSYMWDIPANNMFTYDEGVAVVLVLELNSGLLHYNGCKGYANVEIYLGFTGRGVMLNI